MNAAFTPSANVLPAANKARGMLYSIQRSLTCLTKEIFVPLYSALVRLQLEYTIQANCPYLKKDTNHLERIQRAATRWLKGLRGLTYEERLQALKLQPLGKRRLGNHLALTHKILYSHIDLNATHLFKFSRRPGLRRSSIRLRHQTGRTRRRNRLTCRIFNNSNRLPFQSSGNRAAQIQTNIRLLCLLIHFSLYSIFDQIWSFLGTLSLPDQ